MGKAARNPDQGSAPSARVRGSAVPGWFHSFIFYSFVVLVVTTSVVGLDYDFGTSLFKGWIYVRLTLGADVGRGVDLGRGRDCRRASLRGQAEDYRDGARQLMGLLLLALLVLTGFAVEALRIAVLGDRWMYLSPIGWALSEAFTGMSRETAGAVHVWLWWLHAVLAMAWIASIPFTKFFHLLALPSNVFFAKLGPRGALKRVDIEAIMTADDFDEATLPSVSPRLATLPGNSGWMAMHASRADDARRCALRSRPGNPSRPSGSCMRAATSW